MTTLAEITTRLTAAADGGDALTMDVIALLHRVANSQEAPPELVAATVRVETELAEAKQMVADFSATLPPTPVG